MNLKPSNGRIVVEEIEYASESTIIHVVRTSTNEKFARGRVIAASEGFYTANGSWIDATVEVGDIIWYNKFNAAEVKVSGRTYMIMPEGEAMATEVE